MVAVAADTPPEAVNAPVTPSVDDTVAAPVTVSAPVATAPVRVDVPPTDKELLAVTAPANVLANATFKVEPKNAFWATAKPPFVWMDAVAVAAVASDVSVT